MRVKLLFFSVLRDVAGADELDWEIEGKDEVTVGELLEGVYERWPKMREWDDRALVAVDLNYAAKEETVADGQEVAVMPPVQGG